MRSQNTHPLHKEIIYGCALIALALAGGTGWWTWETTRPTTVNQEQSTTETEKVNPPVVIPQPAERFNPNLTTKAVKLQPQTYWLKVEGEKIRLIPQQVAVKAGVTTEVALHQALNHLLTSQQTSNLTSTIPVGTQLLSLRVTPEGIYVNLSSKFTQGGGSTSMIYRVAQIIYTATSLDQQAQVFLSVDGKQIDENHPLGGEGLILRQPITRQQFTQDFELVRA